MKHALTLLWLLLAITALGQGTARRANIYDVRKFGAIADDNIEDDAQIQAAINAASTNVLLSGARGIVFIPEGLFLIGTNNPGAPDNALEGHYCNLIIRSNGVSIVGEDKYRTILKVNKDTTADPLYYGNVIGMGVTNSLAASSYYGVTNCSLRNFTLDCNGMGTVAFHTVDATQIYNSDSTEIVDMVFRNTTQDAVDMQNGDQGFIFRCEFYDITGNGVGAQDRLTIVDNCYSFGSSGGNPESFFTETANTMIVRNCVGEEMSAIANVSGGGSIYLENCSMTVTNQAALTNILGMGGNITIDGCVIRGIPANNSETQIMIYGGTNRNLTVRNSEMYGKRAILADHMASFTSTGNTYANLVAGHPAIMLNGCQLASVKSDQFLSGAGGYGIANTNVASRTSIMVTDCTFYGATIRVVPAFLGATNWLVSSCHFSGGSSLYFGPGGGNLSGNNTFSGLHFNTSSDTFNTTCSSNIISGCKLGAVTLDSSVGNGQWFEGCMFPTAIAGSATAITNAVFMNCYQLGGVAYNPNAVLTHTDAAWTAGGYRAEQYGVITMDNAAGTLTLPSAVTFSKVTFRVKNLNAANLTIARTGGQSIDGVAADVVMLTKQYRQFTSDGANWQITGGY